MSRKKRRHLARYTKQAPYMKIISICSWDRDESGKLKVFESENAIIQHETSCGERRRRGEYPAGGYENLGEVLCTTGPSACGYRVL